MGDIVGKRRERVSRVPVECNGQGVEKMDVVATDALTDGTDDYLLACSQDVFVSMLCVQLSIVCAVPVVCRWWKWRQCS